MNIAIITGASSGLGTEYYRALCSARDDLDEIWLIARREEELRRTATLCPNRKTLVFPLDLADPASVRTVSARLDETDATVAVLINNAGFGVLGPFEQADPERQTGMIDVNIRALTALTSAVLPRMPRGSFVINVASIAAFAPNPRLAVYSSTKAYVYSFSLCLREELKPRGVNVLAVCPGPMETGFLPTAGITKENSPAFAHLPYCSPAQIARKSLRRAARGKAVSIDRAFYRFYRVAARILPHTFVMKFSKA